MSASDDGDDDEEQRDRDEFARSLAELLRADPRVTSVTLREDDFALEVQLEEGETTRLFLDNYFHESRDLPPGEREVDVLRRVSAALRPPEATPTWSAAAARVLPVLRPHGFFRLDAVVSGQKAPSVASQPFLPYLDLALVLDEPDRMSYVTLDDLASWGVDPENALVQAVENAGRLPAPEFDEETALYSVDAGDTYESSRLAIPGLLASFSDRVEGRPVAIIPTRSRCVIAGDADPIALQALAEMAQQEYESSNRSLSPAVYTVDGAGEVVPLELAPDHPASHAVRLGHVKLALTEYGTQKETLDIVHEREGTDIFVASLTGTIRHDGLPFTWTMWGEGIDSLLPAADLVRFMFEEPEGTPPSTGFMVPFDRVSTILGAAFAPASGHRPVRYRVTAHPPRAMIERLRAESIEIEDFEPDA
ncbi:MAG TPA: hypothetical protein VM261_28650 [Kofleriaceae bacterium]|nr:hypothetical protein [Kofleriaceae bacterium]